MGSAPWLPPGAPCDPQRLNYVNGCTVEADCDPRQRTCRVIGAPGAYCEHTTDCDQFQNLHCDLATHQCTSPLPAGASCMTPDIGANDPCVPGTPVARCDPQTSLCVPLSVCY